MARSRNHPSASQEAARAFLRAAVLPLLTLVLVVALPSTHAEERRQIGQGEAGRPHNFMALGGLHSLVVVEGRVHAWGANNSGQLGDGTTIDRNTPVQVSQASGMVGVIAVAAGAEHSLALDSNGDIWAWGRNAVGQLGDGGNADRSLPVRLAGVFSGIITDIDAGGSHSMALDSKGDVWSWGGNNYGQLGDGSMIDRNVPVPLVGLAPPGVKAISAGVGHSLVLDARGVIYSWGLNNRGQLGRATLPTVLPMPITVPFPPQRFIEIVAGGEHSLAIQDDGRVWAWGADGAGQLGDGAPPLDQLVPVAVGQTNGFTRAVRIAVGNTHSLALTARGRVYAWGINVEGQLGDGSTLPGSSAHSPVLSSAIPGLPGATAIAAGGEHSGVLMSDAKIKTWGSNMAGQIGNGGSAPVNVPTEIVSLELQRTIVTAGAWKQSYTLRADGSVLAWGDNTEAQLGDGTVNSRSLPERVDGVENIIALTGGNSNVLALRSDGTVWGWGQNIYDQMGPNALPGLGCPAGHNDKVCVPISMGLTDVKAIAAGTYFHLAIKDDGTLWAWGQNSHGQLGDGGTSDSATPIQVREPGSPSMFLEGVISVAAGGGHTIALLGDGSPWTWGRNTNCELGQGGCCLGGAQQCQPQQLFPPDVLLPQPVPGLSAPMTAVTTALYHHTLVLDQHGLVWAWGNNGTGQLGNGALPGVSALPGFVRGPGGAGFLQDIVAIAAGGFHSLAIQANGSLLGWGDNSSGQLADGTTNSSPFPKQPNCQSNIIGLPAGNCVSHTMVRKDDWTRCGAGLNDFGQLGDGTMFSSSAYVCQTSIVGWTLLLEDPTIGRMFWEPHPLVTKYYVYRGLRGAGSQFTYTHACQTPGGVFVPESFEFSTPAPGGLYYFLVSGRTACAGESNLGRDSSFVERPNTAACPP